MPAKKAEPSEELTKALRVVESVPLPPKMETREVGSVREIDIETLRLIYHKSGNPAEEAVMLKELLDRGLRQADIAKLLEVNQAQISRKLKLLELTPALFERVLSGEIKARTGYQLARLPKERQREFEKMERVTMRASEEAVRDFVLNKDVVRLIRDFEDEGGAGSSPATAPEGAKGTPPPVLQVLNDKAALGQGLSLNPEQVRQLALFIKRLVE